MIDGDKIPACDHVPASVTLPAECEWHLCDSAFVSLMFQRLACDVRLLKTRTVTSAER